MEIKRNQVCPVCGDKPHVLHFKEPWDDYLAECSNCGFSYSMLGDTGEDEKMALFLWDYDVQVNGLECLSLSKIDNQKEVKKWKERREWFLQRNKKQD